MCIRDRTRDVYLAIWIVLFFLLGLYLMRKIKFAHDSDLPYIGVFRFVLIIAVFSFALYMVPGLFGAPLKAISGLLPPKSSLQFDLSRLESQNLMTPVADYPAGSDEACARPKYADKFDLPYGLKGYFDLEQGLACAKERNMPVFIDFKGHACSNCKEMEARVWSDPEVLQRLRNNFVIIALYCDDRTRLPESEWFTSEIDGKIKKTIGQVNTNHEIEMFGTNTQPLYAITDHEGNPLVDIVNSYGYNSNFIKDNKLDNRPIISLLAGSRKQEVKYNLPIMLTLIEKLPDYQFVIAGAPSLASNFYQKFIDGYDVKLVFGQTYQTFKQSVVSVVTSGTATLESALLNTPEVVCYRGNILSMLIGWLVIKVKYISLVNLIMNKPVVSELIQNNLSPARLFEEVRAILPNGPKRSQMINDFAELKAKLGVLGVSDRIAKKMVRFLQDYD